MGSIAGSDFRNDPNLTEIGPTLGFALHWHGGAATLLHNEAVVLGGCCCVENGSFGPINTHFNHGKQMSGCLPRLESQPPLLTRGMLSAVGTLKMVCPSV